MVQYLPITYTYPLICFKPPLGYLEYLIFNRKPVAGFELRQLQRLILRDEVFAVGTGNALELYPSEQAYHEYQELEEERRKKLEIKQSRLP